MAQHRLFAALRPPAAVCGTLRALMGGVPGARWQRDDQLHRTLRFIGSVDRHQADDIAAALGQVHHPAMTLTLGEPGSSISAAGSIRCGSGVRPRELVRMLHNRIDQALRGAGIAPDTRAFLPHITIARFARGSWVTPEVARRIPAPVRPDFTGRTFELFESHLGSEGAIYETIARYPLVS